MEDKLFDRRRVGKFFVAIKAIDDGIFPEMIKYLGITIVRAESMYLNSSIEYIGICPSFDIVPDVLVPPEYLIIGNYNEGVITYEVKKR